LRECAASSPRAWQAVVDVVDDIEGEVVEIFFFELSVQSAKSPADTRASVAKSLYLSTFLLSVGFANFDPPIFSWIFFCGTATFLGT
jgi:hypothetical protein